jgi:ABC-2 type transport system permease protein
MMKEGEIKMKKGKKSEVKKSDPEEEFKIPNEWLGLETEKAKVETPAPAKELRKPVEVEEEDEEIKAKARERDTYSTRVELRGAYAVWLREVKRFARDRARLIITVISPLIWLVLFGLGFAGFLSSSGSVNYLDYLFPGIVTMTLIFGANFFGISSIFDRQFGFLKEMLIAPVRRLSVFTGKMLGGATNVIFQGIIVLLLSFIFAVPMTPAIFLGCLGVMGLVAIGFVSMSLIIASRIKSFEAFGFLLNLIILPLFFSSGAVFPIAPTPTWFVILTWEAWGQYLPIAHITPLFQLLYYIHTESTLTLPSFPPTTLSLPGTILPINGVPSWFQILNFYNPLSYAVDAIKGIIIGNTVVSFGFMTTSAIAQALLLGNMVNPMWVDLAVLGAFAAAMVALGALVCFRTQK